ncbi:lipoprotein [Pseudomonas sp. 2822-17]
MSLAGCGQKGPWSNNFALQIVEIVLRRY